MSIQLYEGFSKNMRCGAPRKLFVFFLDYEPTIGYVFDDFSKDKGYYELNPIQLNEAVNEFDSGGFKEYKLDDGAINLTLELFEISSDSLEGRKTIAKNLELILKESKEVK